MDRLDDEDRSTDKKKQIKVQGKVKVKKLDLKFAKNLPSNMVTHRIKESKQQRNISDMISTFDKLASNEQICLNTNRDKHDPICTARELADHAKSVDRKLLKTKSFTRLPCAKPNRNKSAYRRRMHK